MNECSLETHETLKIIREEREDDTKYEALLNRKFNCTEWFENQFKEDVKQGDFMESVEKQIEVDRRYQKGEEIEKM